MQLAVYIYIKRKKTDFINAGSSFLVLWTRNLTALTALEWSCFDLLLDFISEASSSSDTGSSNLQYLCESFDIRCVWCLRSFLSRQCLLLIQIIICSHHYVMDSLSFFNSWIIKWYTNGFVPQQSKWKIHLHFINNRLCNVPKNNIAICTTSGKQIIG